VPHGSDHPVPTIRSALGNPKPETSSDLHKMSELVSLCIDELSPTSPNGKAMSKVTTQTLSELPEFDQAMRKLIAVPKGVIEEREQKWQAAKKKAAKKR
jgi:hypothetical protein